MMMGMRFEKELGAARLAALRAGELALRYWNRGIEAEEKADESPVTVADRECERAIVETLTDRFAEDGLLGEEGAARESRNGRRWIIDPIDGTRDFVRGNRLFCTLIGLEVDGVPEVGVAHFAALNETYWAVRGQGAWRNDEAIGISSIGAMEKAVVCYNALNHVTRRPLAEKVLPLLAGAWAVRSMGGALDAMFVASGKAEIWVEPVAKAWDLIALKVIAEEAGALFFDYAGENTIYGGNAVICTPPFEGLMREFVGR